DHLHGLKLCASGGSKVAGLECADQSLEMGAGEVVGAADRAMDTQAQTGQERFVAAEQDVECPVVDLDASLELDEVGMGELQAAQVGDSEPRLVEELGH